ncbi:MAG: hypothetical protein ABSH20_14100 [Tepidisphaeraceae bacterium]|jgi:hypothetical protein
MNPLDHPADIARGKRLLLGLVSSPNGIPDQLRQLDALVPQGLHPLDVRVIQSDIDQSHG